MGGGGKSQDFSDNSEEEKENPPQQIQRILTLKDQKELAATPKQANPLRSFLTNLDDQSQSQSVHLPMQKKSSWNDLTSSIRIKKDTEKVR